MSRVPLRTLAASTSARMRRVGSLDATPVLVMDWLGGPILETLPYPSAVDASSPGAPSPAGYQSCSQDVLEPILVEAVQRSRNAEVSHGTELPGFAQDAEGVAVRLHNQSTGRTYQVRYDHPVR